VGRSRSARHPLGDPRSGRGPQQAWATHCVGAAHPEGSRELHRDLDRDRGALPYHRATVSAVCNAGVCTSLVDRLLHRSELIAIDGSSDRLEEATERAATKAKTRAARRRHSRPPRASRVRAWAASTRRHHPDALNSVAPP
jgi:hypothetical protein